MLRHVIIGRLMLLAGFLIWLCGGAGSAAAADEGWTGSINFGLTANSGNSRSYSGNFSAETAYKGAPSEFHASTSVTYGRTEGVVSASKAAGAAQYNYLFTERLSAYLTGGAEHDGVADLLWRITLGPGGGYYFIKQSNLSLIGELGVSYFRERFASRPVDDYYTLRVAERGEWKITDTAKLWEKAEYFPALDALLDNDRYLVKAEAGLESAITTHATMRFVIQDSYDNSPASGRRPNDTTYIASIGYKF
jgi:putative salt-induced outer membrane protein YdiY